MPGGLSLTHHVWSSPLDLVKTRSCRVFLWLGWKMDADNFLCCITKDIRWGPMEGSISVFVGECWDTALAVTDKIISTIFGIIEKKFISYILFICIIIPIKIFKPLRFFFDHRSWLPLRMFHFIFVIIWQFKASLGWPWSSHLVWRTCRPNLFHHRRMFLLGN